MIASVDFSKPAVRVCVNVRGGYYLCYCGHLGQPWSRGPQECQASPVFLTRQEAVKYAADRGWYLAGE